VTLPQAVVCFGWPIFESTEGTVQMPNNRLQRTALRAAAEPERYLRPAEGDAG